MAGAFSSAMPIELASENECQRSRGNTIAREYSIPADQGRPDILELFHDDAEINFPKFRFGLKEFHTAECPVNRGHEARLLADVSATSSSFATAEYPAYTSTSTLTRDTPS
jgi:hypothetical protein